MTMVRAAELHIQGAQRPSGTELRKSKGKIDAQEEAEEGHGEQIL